MVSVNQQTILRDIGQLKSVLIKRTDNLDSKELFKSTLHSVAEEFEAFCQKLEDDRNYRDLFVSVCLMKRKPFASQVNTYNFSNYIDI